MGHEFKELDRVYINHYRMLRGGSDQFIAKRLRVISTCKRCQAYKEREFNAPYEWKEDD